MRKLFISIAILVGLLFLQPPSAWAHAQLSDSYPKNNAVLQSMPTEVWIEFDGNLTEIDGANVNTLLVRDTSGKELQASRATVAGARIITKISNATGTGKIIASYRVVSEDGHPVEGAISFSIQGNELQSPSPSVSASSTKVHKETQPQVSPSKNEETKPSFASYASIRAGKPSRRECKMYIRYFVASSVSSCCSESSGSCNTPS